MLIYSMSTELVSVLMVTYNSSKFIKDAIQSVLQQTYSNFELIISDDNSSDDTWNIINSYNDPRIKKNKNSENVGEYKNRNLAFSMAKGKYAIFIDGDDLIYPYALQILSDFAYKYPQCGMILARPWDERIIYPVVISPHQFYCFEYLDRGIAGINFTKIMFQTDAFRDLGCFDNDKIKMGDVCIQFKIGGKFPSLIIPDGFTWWRRRPGQASEALLKKQYLFLMDSLQYLIPFLHTNSLFNQEERKQAYINIYSNYLHFVIKEILKLRFKTTIQLLRQHPVPFKYLSSVFKSQRRNYFDKFNGENPLFGNTV